MEAGTFPVSWLFCTCSALKAERFWNTFGIEPAKLLPARLRYLSAVRSPT